MAAESISASWSRRKARNLPETTRLPPQAWMNSGTHDWAASARWWRARSKNGRASNRERRYLGTSSAAARRARSIACWRRATDWARSIWYIAASLVIWQRCAETRLFQFRWRKRWLQTVRWTRRFSTPRRAFLTNSKAKVKETPDRLGNDNRGVGPSRPGESWNQTGFCLAWGRVWGILTKQNPETGLRFEDSPRANVSGRNPTREPSGKTDTAPVATALARCGGPAQTNVDCARNFTVGSGGGGFERLGFLVSTEP